MDEQIEFSAVLSNIDDLVSLLNRIIEADKEDRSEEPGIVKTLGEGVVSSFVNSLGKTILAVFQDLDHKLSDGTLKPAYMEAHLNKAHKIYGFCRIVDQKYGKQVSMAVKRVIKSKSRDIMNTITNMKEMGDDVPHLTTYTKLTMDFAQLLTEQESNF